MYPNEITSDYAFCPFGAGVYVCVCVRVFVCGWVGAWVAGCVRVCVFECV
jgi:hypothetical protein